jgi:hypothetical protein
MQHVQLAGSSEENRIRKHTSKAPERIFHGYIVIKRIFHRYKSEFRGRVNKKPSLQINHGQRRLDILK